MSTEVEAVGAAVTAGLAASVIDGKKPRGAAAHGACANCGAEITGAYCSTCGQPAHVHRTLGHMVEEFLHGLLHFDTRAWRTLPMLVFRPGALTRDYIHGKRARYISPLAIFLLAVFTMFVVFAFAGGQAGFVEADKNAPVVAFNKQAAKVEGDPESMYEAISKAARDGDFVVNTGWADFDKKVRHKLENPELAVYKFQNAAYKFAFLLAPISLPFVWLLFFWKRGLTLFDHTVYILYSLSFVSLLFIVTSLMANWPPLAEFAPLLLLTIPVHAFFQMKGGYSLGWFSALWRTPVLMIFAGIGLLLFLLAILAVGLVG